MPSVHATLAVFVLVLTSGCQGSIGDAGSDPTITTPESPESRAPVVCDESISPGPQTPLLRLTRAQYNNAVRDLLDIDTQPASGFPAEDSIGGVLVAGAVDATMLQHYQLAARSVAAAATANIESIVDCGGLSGTLCARDFATRLATLAYRRPLEGGEVDALMGLYELGAAAEVDSALEFDAGIATLIQVVLQSPHFLYRPEFSEAQGTRALTSIERATRLSFFLWNSIPDQELLDAATEGLLDTGEGVRSQAQRMVGDRRAVHAMRAFFRSWFDVELGEKQKSSALIDDFAPLRSAAEAELDAFIEHLMFESSGTLSELLTTNFTFVNEVTAPYYGLNSEDFGVEMERVELDARERRGILTMLPVLLAHSGTDTSSPILRGVFVRRNLLCGVLPDPPDDIETPEVEEGVSERERLRQQREDSEVCASCHVRIDFLGLPFESFDALGRFRTEEHGEPIDTSGAIGFTPSSDSPVVDALDLAERLAGSDDVASCAARFFFQSATGRFPRRSDTCAVRRVEDTFRESDRSLSALIVALVESDPFLFQDNSEVSP